MARRGCPPIPTFPSGYTDVPLLPESDGDVHHDDRDRHTRDRFKDNPYYESCLRFCERWDQCAFDPDYDTLPLETFEPMVRRLFAEPRHKFV